MTQAERFRRAHEDAPVVCRHRYPQELEMMRERIRAWRLKTGDDIVTAALAIEARELRSFRRRVALAAAVDMLAEEAQP